MSAEASVAAAASAAASNLSSPPANPAAAAAASGVSIWDFVLFGQQAELQAYVNMLQERDDNCADEKEIVIPKILDGRVEQSVRFQFVNPLVGQHGYEHVLSGKSPNKMAKEVVLKGSTPLHYAVHLRLPEIVQVLLQAGSDPSLMDEKFQTAYRLARIQNDERMIAVFQQYRLFAHRQRKAARALNTEVESSRKHLAQYQHDTRVLTTVRQTLMAQVVALWWRYTTSIVRRQAIASQKQGLASQLENLVQVSTQTVQNLEREKGALTEERQLLTDKIASLQQQVAHLESQLTGTREQLAQRDGELQDRNALRGEIQKLQQALKSSLEMISQQQQIMLSQNSTASSSSAASDVVLQTLQKELAAQQVELQRVQQENHSLLTAQAEAHAAKQNAAALKNEVDRLRGALSVLQSTTTSSSAVSSSSVTQADVLAHPDYKRMEAQLAATQRENERLRSVELQLREQLRQAFALPQVTLPATFSGLNISSASSSGSLGAAGVNTGAGGAGLGSEDDGVPSLQ